MNSSLLAKLQKLSNHRDSANAIGSIPEAEAFASKIQELLFTYKLTLSEVEIACEERAEPVGQELIDTADFVWQSTLAIAAASASFCRVVQYNRGRLIVFVGTDTNRQSCVTMFRYFEALGRSLCKSDSAKRERDDKYVYNLNHGFGPFPLAAFRRRWNRCFLDGYSLALSQRLREDRKSLTAESQKAGSSLIYVERNTAALEAFMAAKYPNLREGRARAWDYDEDALAFGYSHGAKVSIESRGALAVETQQSGGPR